MSIDKFLNPDYKPDENTREEIEILHKNGDSLLQISYRYYYHINSQPH